MVVDWEQETGLLMTSGDVRIIRIWDTDREMKVQVTSTPLSPSPFPSQSTSCAVPYPLHSQSIQDLSVES